MLLIEFIFLFYDTFIIGFPNEPHNSVPRLVHRYRQLRSVRQRQLARQHHHRGKQQNDLASRQYMLNMRFVQVDPIDGGTDNGFTFTAPNWPTEPQGVAYRITSRYPAHPAGSFFYPYQKRLPAIGTFQFIKVRNVILTKTFS